MSSRRVPWRRMLAAATRLPAFASPLSVLGLQLALKRAVARSNFGELLGRLEVRGRTRPTVKAWVNAFDHVLPGRGFFRTTCLYRSLARFALLRAAGEDVTLMIGVAVRRDNLVAHAWLTVAGKPFGRDATPHERFTTIYRYPGSPAEQQSAIPNCRVSPGVYYADLPDGEGVLLHLGTRMYYLLNPTGAATWRRLAGSAPTTESELASDLATTHPGVARAEVAADVAALLNQFRAEALIE